MDVFNLTTPSTSLTGAEMMPRVKKEPMAGGNGSPRLQATHPGSKPSPLLLAPREGASMDMPGSNAIHGGLPELGLGGDPRLGHIMTAVPGLGHFAGVEVSWQMWAG